MKASDGQPTSSDGLLGAHHPSASDLDAPTISSVALEIRRQIQRDELGFIASAMSHWHALGVDAWVKYLRGQGETRGGLVLLLPLPGKSLTITREDFPFCQEDGHVTFIRVRKLVEERKISRLLHAFHTTLGVANIWLQAPRRGDSSQKPRLSLASPTHTSAAVFVLAQVCNSSLLRSRRVNFTILDEGLGSYIGRETWRISRDAERAPGGRFTKFRAIDNFLYETWSSAQRFALRRYPIQPRLAFLKDPITGQVTANPLIAAEYRTIIRDIHVTPELPRRKKAPVACLLTQPFSELRLIQEDIERRVVKAAVRTLVSNGFDVIVKPHPREVENKHLALPRELGSKVKVLDRNFAVERMLGQLAEEDLVVGFSSTSLLSARLIFNLETLTLGPYLVRTAPTGNMLGPSQAAFDILTGSSIPSFSDRFPITDFDG
jgi:hypothetical protein